VLNFSIKNKKPDPFVSETQNIQNPKIGEGDCSMKTEKEKLFARAMAFYHQDGLPAAWKQAARFAGQSGHLATMPDVAAARIGTIPGDMPWETYFTTLTAEYYGLSKSGKPILIIAHGNGPMSTLDGVLKAYSWEYNDKNRDRRGGRISSSEFHDLEAGKYGEVHIVDLQNYVQLYQYPFIQTLRSSEAMSDPVLKARIGPDTAKLVEIHTNAARYWHREQAGVDPENKYNTPSQVFNGFLDRRREQHLRDGAENSDPLIITLSGANNCSYYFGPDRGFRPIEKGHAVAHLISTGRLCHQHQDGNESLVLDVHCHEWTDGVRLVGIKSGANIKSGLHNGPDTDELLKKYWRDLFKPVKNPPEEIGLRALMRFNGMWFTQYPKAGERMDTWEPEYQVSSISTVGDPVLFRTTVGSYHGFFKFGTSELKAIAPPDANAYEFEGEPQLEWHDGNPTHQTCMVQFYRITVDTRKRLIRAKSLAHDYETMMSLVAKGE
jgi:hypothetical protein